jgi:glycosyltransferase involved in cell wall biosynthesis
VKIIHIITRSDLGGAQAVVINLANGMCVDHQVIVVAGEDGPMWDSLDKRIKQIKMECIVRQISPINDIRAICQLIKLYKKEKPDIIHLHSSKVGIIGRLAFPSSKIIYSVHGFDSIRVAYRKFLIFEKILKNRCKAIVVASEYDKNNLMNEGIKDHIHIVYNGIIPPVVSKDVVIDEIKNCNKKIIMCIARISPQKRFESFIKMADLLPKYCFVWIGADKDNDNLPGNLICMRGIQNAQKYIQLADIFVYPSNYEGIPIVIIDAISYGKPVISSDVGGIREIVINDKNGYVIENNDQTFVEKINYILDNENIYKKFSDYSKHLFNEDLIASKMVQKYIDIYQS